MEELIPKTLTLAPAPPMAPLPVPPLAAIPAPPRPITAVAAAPAAPAPLEYEISEESRLARERQEKAIQELLFKRRAYALAVPTNDAAVRARLRRLGEPVTLFGEREMERRERLRIIMARLERDGLLDSILDDISPAAELDNEPPQQQHIQYPFYTEGPPELLDARLDIAAYSLARAKARLARGRRRRDDIDEDLEAEAELVVKEAAGFTLECSEIGDERPLSGCSFSRDGALLATSSWSGMTKVWSMPLVKRIAILKGHTERVTDVSFSPVDNYLATASADRTAKLWNIDGSLVISFNGHVDRLARVAFHPSGKYLGTASFDQTWRLWDVNTGKELLWQEGHSRSVYGITFHPDGSLAASCGLDALARVWDLRSGRSILAFEGHVKTVLAVSFSPNGHLLATGSEDDLCKIWDLRKRKCMYSIPAHKGLISQVKFEPQEGYFLATASFDTRASLWSSQDFKPIKSLAAHEGKVTDLDISGDGQQIATVSHDRTIKIWCCKNNQRDDTMEVD